MTFCIQTVEMYIHRSGYHPPNEIMSTHCRRRYRLMPPKHPNPNIPPCDPSLWIVHYSRADPQNHYPANKIPLIPQVQVSLAQRQYLQQYGQLVRKEFMFNDRNNWPTINLPGGQTSPYSQSSGVYPNNILAQMNRTSEQPYYQQPSVASTTRGLGPSPAKRARQAPPSHPPGSSGSTAAANITQDATVEEEEDTSRGDLMDFLTPRDISKMRYIQHHEWMEEVFSSPYSTGQIVPVDLGLGRKGELEQLTRGFFDAPTSTAPQARGETGLSRVGRMDAAKAEEFTKRATNKIAQMNAELTKIRRQHARRMVKLNKGALVKEAEMRLRNAVNDPSATGTEIWRLEGHLEASVETATSEAGAPALRRTEKVDDIVKEVEAVVGKDIGIVKELICVQIGGLEEKTVSDDNGQNEYNSADAVSNEHAADEDVDMTNSPANSYDQPNRSVSTPNQQTPVAQELPPAHHDQSAIEASTPQVDEPSRPVSSVGNRPESIHHDEMTGAADMDLDVEMPEVSKQYEADSVHGETSDWVLVDKSEEATAQLPDDYGHSTEFDEQNMAHPSIHTPGVFVSTPGSGLQGLTPQERGSSHGELETHDFGHFGELNAAGETITGYEVQGGDEELDVNGDLGIDTSAFGDALHGTEGNDDLPATHQADDASF